MAYCKKLSFNLSLVVIVDKRLILGKKPFQHAHKLEAYMGFAVYLGTDQDLYFLMLGLIINP